MSSTTSPPWFVNLFYHYLSWVFFLQQKQALPNHPTLTKHPSPNNSAQKSTPNPPNSIENNGASAGEEKSKAQKDEKTTHTRIAGAADEDAAYPNYDGDETSHKEKPKYDSEVQIDSVDGNLRSVGVKPKDEETPKLEGEG